MMNGLAVGLFIAALLWAAVDASFHLQPLSEEQQRQLPKKRLSDLQIAARYFGGKELPRLSTMPGEMLRLLMNDTECVRRLERLGQDYDVKGAAELVLSMLEYPGWMLDTTMYAYSAHEKQVSFDELTGHGEQERPTRHVTMASFEKFTRLSIFDAVQLLEMDEEFVKLLAVFSQFNGKWMNETFILTKRRGIHIISDWWVMRIPTLGRQFYQKHGNPSWLMMYACMYKKNAKYFSKILVKPNRSVQRGMHIIFGFTLDYHVKKHPFDVNLLRFWETQEKGQMKRHTISYDLYTGKFNATSADEVFANGHGGFNTQGIQESIVDLQPVTFVFSIRNGKWQLGWIHPRNLYRLDPILAVEPIIYGSLYNTSLPVTDVEFVTDDDVKEDIIEGTGVKNILCIKDEDWFYNGYKNNIIFTQLEDAKKWLHPVGAVPECIHQFGYLPNYLSIGTDMD